MKSLAHAELHSLDLFSKIIPHLERPASLCSCSAWFLSPSKRGFLAKGILISVSFMTGLKNALSLLSFLKSLRITYFSHLLRFIETNLNEFTQNASNLICQKITFIRRPVREPKILTFTGSLKTSVTIHKCHKVTEYPYICPKARVSQSNVLISVPFVCFDT